MMCLFSARMSRRPFLWGTRTPPFMLEGSSPLGVAARGPSGYHDGRPRTTNLRHPSGPPGNPAAAPPATGRRTRIPPMSHRPVLSPAAVPAWPACWVPFASPGVRRRPPRGGRLRRVGRAAGRRRRGGPRRHGHRRRRPPRSEGEPRDRCPRLGRRPRVHQHAELGPRFAPRRRPVAGRHPPRRHPRGVRRGRVVWAVHRRPEGRDDQRQGDIRYEITWDSLGGFLETLQRRGVSCNVASFVGATTVRECVVGLRRPCADARGAGPDACAGRPRHGRGRRWGSARALIYAPGSYARTDELAALCEVAARHGGMYISHLRSEGDRLLEAVDELIAIARRAKIPAEIYHLKAAGRANWGKLDEVLRRIEAARASGLRITADIYPYTAGATGLDAAMPTWVQAGGLDAWIARLKDSGHPRPGRPRDRRARRRLGEPLQGRRLGRERPAHRVQERPAQAADGQDAGRGREGPGHDARGNHRRPRRRGRQPGRHDLLPDGRGESAQGAEAAVGERLLRRGLARPEGVFLKSNPHPRAYAPSRGCSGVTSASRKLSRWRRPSGALPPCPPRI